MKRNAAIILAFVFVLSGCAGKPDIDTSSGEQLPGGNCEVGLDTDSKPAELFARVAAPMREDADTDLPELPDTLAKEEDLTGEGGYLLLGEITEEDIALYCDNSEERNCAYIRYGDHFQAFEQQVWSDPTVLPELIWDDWDEDGEKELSVKYLRHEGTYYDSEKASPGLVHELVVYEWDGEQWTDIHFHSGGGIKLIS